MTFALYSEDLKYMKYTSYMNHIMISIYLYYMEMPEYTTEIPILFSTGESYIHVCIWILKHDIIIFGWTFPINVK